MSAPPTLPPLLPYDTSWRKWFAAGPRACSLLRAVALVMIFFFGGFGLIYFVVLGLVALPLFLVPCIVGLIYLACAQRMERHQIIPAYIALVITSLHAGLFLLASSLLGYEVIKMAWAVTHPPARGWALESPGERYWILATIVVLFASGVAVLLCISILHLARFIHSVRSPVDASPA